MITTAPAVDADTLRLRHEFLSQPALALTVPQIARLLSVRVDHAAAMAAMLEDEGWLIHSPGGVYRRSEPAMS